MRFYFFLFFFFLRWNNTPAMIGNDDNPIVSSEEGTGND